MRCVQGYGVLCEGVLLCAVVRLQCSGQFRLCFGCCFAVSEGLGVLGALLPPPGEATLAAQIDEMLRAGLSAGPRSFGPGTTPGHLHGTK